MWEPLKISELFEVLGEERKPPKDGWCAFLKWKDYYAHSIEDFPPAVSVEEVRKKGPVYGISTHSREAAGYDLYYRIRGKILFWMNKDGEIVKTIEAPMFGRKRRNK